MEEFVLQTGDSLPHIFIIREKKVMLDYQVALLYGVEIEELLQAVANNTERFPEDFLFMLTNEEYQNLNSQLAISNEQLVLKHRPYAFTEQGVAMASALLNTNKAKSIHISLIRDFLKMKQILETDGDLIMDLKEMEEKYDHQFKVVFEALQQLIKSKETARAPIGFEIKNDTPLI
jgi:phage regulator Rha-like protein